MNIEEFCKQECIRQHADTPDDNWNMLAAFGFAEGIAEMDRPIELWEIIGLGALVDPIANPGGKFRTGPAVFMDGGNAAPAHHIAEWLSAILARVDDFSPEEFYRELMYIHPFRDGNGRVGALVYNILNGTLHDPIAPPEYK